MGGGVRMLGNMLTLGTHVEQPKTQIGQYGVGLKDAAIWASDRLMIETVCEGTRHKVLVDWEALLLSGEWPCACSASSTSRPHRTTAHRLS